MVKYHVGECHIFQEEMNNRSTYGSLASVWKPVNENMLVCLGYDEFISKKNSLSNKYWLG